MKALEKNSLAIDCPSPQVGLDFYDELPLMAAPKWIVEHGMNELTAAITALGDQGPTALWKTLAGDLHIARTQLRIRELAANIEIEKFLHGGGDMKRLELAERLAQDHHRRFLAAAETCARLARGAPTRIRVTAHAAQFNVGAAP